MQPPDPAAARNRLGALATFVGVASGIGPPDRVTEALRGLAEHERKRIRRELEERAASMREQLVGAGLWEYFTSAEQRYLSTAPDKVSIQEWSSAMLHIEGVGVLRWALGIGPVLPPYDVSVPLEALEQSSGALPVDVSLRSPSELEAARAIAELWHWRARARLIASGVLPAPVGVPSAVFEEPVAAVAARAAADGVISHVLRGDFPIADLPFASLPQAEVMRLAAIAYGRQWALNWLCGLAPGNKWDETPTST